MKAPIATETPDESRSNVIPMTSGIATTIANLIETMSLLRDRHATRRLSKPPAVHHASQYCALVPVVATQLLPGATRWSAGEWLASNRWRRSVIDGFGPARVAEIIAAPVASISGTN